MSFFANMSDVILKKIPEPEKNDQMKILEDSNKDKVNLLGDDVAAATISQQKDLPPGLRLVLISDTHGKHNGIAI